jgi:hypothetical protein
LIDMMIWPTSSIRRFGGSLRSWCSYALACATLLTSSSALAASQTGSSAPPAAGAASKPARTVHSDTPDATRAELTTLLEEELRRATDAGLKAPDRAKAQGEAAAIRQRLESGDFRAGDRFLVTIIADSVRRLDMLVREGPALDFQALPSLPIGGVLRSELEGAILQHMARFYRSPEVRVQLLTRISISGAVARPGTYSVPPFALLSDAVMQAGGTLPTANPDKIVIARGGKVIVDRAAYQKAVKDGASVESVGMQPGDEIRVDQRTTHNWGQIVTVGVLSVSVFTAVLALIRSSYSD